MKTVQSDNRFIHVTGCRITALYRKIPKQFGGWKIDIMYDETENDIFPKSMSISIDQTKFGQELLDADFSKKDTRLYYTNGMTDIDIYKSGKDFCIYHSINDGSYVHFFFSAEEFNQLKSWLELENK